MTRHVRELLIGGVERVLREHVRRQRHRALREFAFERERGVREHEAWNDRRVGERRLLRARAGFGRDLVADERDLAVAHEELAGLDRRVGGDEESLADDEQFAAADVLLRARGG